MRMSNLVRYVIVLMFQYGATLTRREAVGLSLLKGEDMKSNFNQTFPGCWLGDQFYMVGDRWSPSLEPHGVIVCVKCQCAQVVKRKVLQLEGRVICTNIKHECPETYCEKPFLRPNTCCKVCPDQDTFYEDQFNSFLPESATIGGVHNNSLSISYSTDTKELFALLVGSVCKRKSAIRTRTVAIVHIVVPAAKNTVQFAVRYSRLKDPIFIRVLDEYGTVLLEKRIIAERSRSGTLHGEWVNVPASFLQYIRQELAFISITTSRHTSGELLGKVKANTRDERATFEAILSSPLKNGIGAFASVYYDVTSRAASYVIHIGGIPFSKLDSDEFFVTFEKDTEIIYQHLLTLSKTKRQLVGKFNVDNRMSKQIARGRLHVRVTSRTGHTMTGVLKPRLIRPDLLSVVNGGNKLRNISGFAVLSLQEDGSLRYKVSVSERHGMVTSITLQRRLHNKNQWKDFAILTHTYNVNITFDREASGYYKKLRSRDTVALLDGTIRLNIKLIDDDQLTGEFQPIPAHLDNGVELFTASNKIVQSPYCDDVGYIWYRLTENCSLAYYTVSTSTIVPSLISIRFSGQVELNARSLDDVTLLSRKNINPEGTITSIPDEMFRGLNNAGVIMRIEFPNGRCDELVNQLHLPNQCWETADDRDSRWLSRTETNEPETDIQSVYRCFHEGKFHNHAESWLPDDRNSCVTCRCERGNVHCDDVPCPTLHCKYPRKTSQECCPVCDDDNETEKKNTGSCYYHGDKRWHPVGMFWHPYVPPFGYSKCALCNCLPETLEVNCTRLACPSLSCPRHQRKRLQKNDCCQVCIDIQSHGIHPFHSKDKSSMRYLDCKFGTTVYRHGDKWHPRLTPFGEMKCYTCSCKDGKSRCRKQKCQKLHCKRQYTPPNRCCPVCIKTKKHSSRRNDKHLISPRLNG